MENKIINIYDKNRNYVTILLTHDRILTEFDNGKSLYTSNSYTKRKNYKRNKLTNVKDKNDVKSNPTTLSNNNDKYIRENITKNWVIKNTHKQPNLVIPNRNIFLRRALCEYQHKQIVVNKYKVNEIEKNIKSNPSLLKDSPPIALSNTCLVNKNFKPLHNDYIPIESNPDYLLNPSNKYAIKYENKSNKCRELEKLSTIKTPLSNTQRNKNDQNDIKLSTDCALSENPWAYRNYGFPQDKLLRERLKLCQHNINNEAELKKTKVGNKKVILKKNRLIEQKQPQTIAVKKRRVNDNKYTIIKDNLERKKELSSNHDLLKKQNNIQVQNTLNHVLSPLKKDITKESGLQEYKHYINTDSKQNEIKEINKIGDSYDNTKNKSSNKKEIVIEICMENQEKMQKSNKREQVIEIYMNNTKKIGLKGKNDPLKINDPNKKYDVSNKDSSENLNELKCEANISNNIDNNNDKFLEHEKNSPVQLDINNKKEIIRPKDEDVKVLDILPINKTEEKSNNNPNLDENDFIDLFDNDDIQDVVGEVLSNDKINELSIDEIYLETERLLFDKIIGPKPIKGKYYKVKKYLKIFALYILPIILSTISISLVGVNISGLMGVRYMDAALYTIGETALFRTSDCLVNTASNAMSNIATVLPTIDIDGLGLPGLFSSFVKGAAAYAPKAIKSTFGCVTNNAILFGIDSATVSVIGLMNLHIFYPISITINVLIIIYVLIEIIMRLNDMGKFDKFHKFRKKYMNKLKKFNAELRKKFTDKN
ncbi:Plasmodium exported protein, unknown function [Plasmodium vinckei vinckei]|uniref:Uncharacterized protein n=1 Tax=Plasmodium vinckei vinckei TaxID=54757 RepID=A0A449BNR5_PLAVN|nr:Plasmodium exported protein, unknown function [Plasmodium vinckei vinckei]VEV55106.1 Plasmodium exported protein, unknown function [Plasmodium vinckei vinckei]